jgi:DNA helicase II / ATP-dependent DNA helicase PcrA
MPSTPRDRVEAFVADQTNVSTAQRDAVKHPGDVFLRACPGSGKTRTVGVRLAWWAVHPVVIDGLERLRRVAAVSYSNVAVQEIGNAADQAGAPVLEPNFLGTIHRFVLRYIVRPFGTSVMGCTTAPRLVGDTATRTESVIFNETRWVRRVVSIWDLHFRADGSLVLAQDASVLHQTDVAPEVIAARVQVNALELKHQLAAEGLMSMSDALYWAQRALERPENAAAVAARFDELIVDEAQDTTDTQLRCLELLKDAGLPSLVLVGDPDQAIYGFAGADPERLLALAAENNLDGLSLSENWRSSQEICNVAVRFSARGQPDDAVSECRDIPHRPELYVYDPDEPRAPVARFQERLEDLGISSSRVAVVCRSGSTVDAVNAGGGVSFRGRLADLAELAHAMQHDGPVGAPLIARVESDLAGHAWPELAADDIDPNDRGTLRAAVLALASQLPATTMNAKQWAAETRATAQHVICGLAAPVCATGRQYKPVVSRGAGSFAVEDLLAVGNPALRARTIHTVKGESYDATLTIAAKTPRFDHAAAWLTHSGEERRIAYVALTRARIYMAIAVPSTCGRATVAGFEARGFRCVG